MLEGDMVVELVESAVRFPPRPAIGMIERGGDQRANDGLARSGAMRLVRFSFRPAAAWR